TWSLLLQSRQSAPGGGLRTKIKNAERRPVYGFSAYPTGRFPKMCATQRNSQAPGWAVSHLPSGYQRNWCHNCQYRPWYKNHIGGGRLRPAHRPMEIMLISGTVGGLGRFRPDEAQPTCRDG